METDILIVGAGALGTSSAYYLKKRDPSLKVIVFEKFGGPAQGNNHQPGELAPEHLLGGDGRVVFIRTGRKDRDER